MQDRALSSHHLLTPLVVEKPMLATPAQVFNLKMKRRLGQVSMQQFDGLSMALVSSCNVWRRVLSMKMELYSCENGVGGLHIDLFKHTRALCSR